MHDFHFIRPMWLLAIFALLLAVYLLKKHRISQSGWQQLIPPHLAKVLIEGQNQGRKLSLTLPFIIGLLSIVSLAGPTWKKLPQPVYQVARGAVLIMDMSYSMFATDLTPNRLTRARYKAVDLLDTLNEGEIGLVAYAGDAFTISPLTEDINNIKLLLPSLTPDLMPELGSNPLAALTLASNMLINAGHIEGDIYWFTDGIDYEDIQDINQWSSTHNYRLNIMGIGTKAGAPIKLSNGELMKDSNGAIIIPTLNEGFLEGVSAKGHGYYSKISNSSSDIDYLVSQPLTSRNDEKSKSSQTGDQWQEFGPYLLLAVIPLVLGYFRRGILLSLLPLMILSTPSKPVHADLWSDLWKTKDQQGQTQFDKKEFKQAAQTFKDKKWKGSSYYQAGEYEQALKAYQSGTDADSFYNQGNALAKLNRLDEAISAYDKALGLSPNHSDALANKKLLEQLKQQQEQQNQDQQNKDKQDKDSEQNNDQQSADQQQNQDQKNQDQQDQNQNSQQNKDDQSSEQQQKSDKTEQEQKQKQKNKEQENKDAEAKQNEDELSDEEKEQQRQAQAIKAQQDKETEQKHQQLLNKVTDDPYLLLRNKMQLEYQKRRQNRTSVGVKKKW